MFWDYKLSLSVPTWTVCGALKSWSSMTPLDWTRSRATAPLHWELPVWGQDTSQAPPRGGVSGMCKREDRPRHTVSQLAWRHIGILGFVWTSLIKLLAQQPGLRLDQISISAFPFNHFTDVEISVVVLRGISVPFAALMYLPLLPIDAFHPPSICSVSHKGSWLGSKLCLVRQFVLWPSFNQIFPFPLSMRPFLSWRRGSWRRLFTVDIEAADVKVRFNEAAREAADSQGADSSARSLCCVQRPPTPLSILVRASLCAVLRGASSARTFVWDLQHLGSLSYRIAFISQNKNRLMSFRGSRGLFEIIITLRNVDAPEIQLAWYAQEGFYRSISFKSW